MENENTAVNVENPKRCTKEECVREEGKASLSCSTCLRSVHYQCTKLPVYQIELYVQRKLRKFTCVNCVDVSPRLVEMMCEYDPDQSLDVEVITKALQEISFQKDEALLQKDDALSTYNKLKKKQSKMQERIQSDKQMKERYEEAIKNLKAEVSSCKDKIKCHTERETKLEKEVDKLRNNWKEAEKTNSSDMLLSRLDRKFKEFEDLIRKEFVDYSKNLGEKIDKAVEKTYADAVSSNEIRFDNQEDTRGTCLRKRLIVRNEEITEENERKSRACNLIIHRVVETSMEKDQAKATDKAFIENLIQDIGSTASIKDVYRLGKKNDKTIRPIKVILNCESAKNEVLENLSNLKNNVTYRGISVTEDYILTERELIKDFVEQAKTQNSQLPPDASYQIKVRGTPKNGLCLKQVKKKTPHQ